jgi:N-methylhydantoinase B
MKEIGIEDLRPVSKTLAERTERAFRKAVSAIPDGVYSSSIESDGYTSPVRLCCSISVNGSSIVIDCEGTSPQVSPGAINVVYNFTYSAFVYALKCILDPHTPYNEGITRAVTVTVPPRTILNAEFPAPVFARNQTAHYLPTLVMSAIAKAAPERVMAACGSPTNRTMFAGRHGHDGKPFSFMMISSGGMGACIDKDGHSCTPYPSNSGSPPVEVLETVVPLLVRRKALRVDSGGAGTHRGGLGVELIVENASAETMQVASRMDRVTNPPEGLAGGHSGALAGIWHNGTKPFPPKGRGQLAPTETLVIHSPGGGGYGDPARRDRALVEADLKQELISGDSAEKLYGWTSK